MEIIATICGGKNWSLERILSSINAGVNVFRISSSFRTHEEDKEIIERIRNAMLINSSNNIKILHDVNKGVKKRLKNKSNIDVNKGEYIKLYFSNEGERKKDLVVDWPGIVDIIDDNTVLYIGDGEIAVKVNKLYDRYISGEVMNSGRIKSRKAVNIENTSYINKAINEENKLDIIFSSEMNLDYIALSFVKSSKDYEDYQSLLRRYNLDYNAKVIAKVETKEAIDNLESIVKSFDGVMVARGDLALQVDFAKLGVIQHRIIELCRKHEKYCIVATQMLESVISRFVPSRAEIIDITNAVVSGASASMLGPETCMNHDNIRAIATMKNIIDAAESV